LASFALAKNKSKYCWIINKGIGQIHTGSEKPRLRSFYELENDGEAFHTMMIVPNTPSEHSFTGIPIIFVVILIH
jgi:hypothetical protein